MSDAFIGDILQVDGVGIRNPSKLQLQRYNLTKSGRVLSGKMTMEIIAQKRKLQITYDVLSGAELDTILGLVYSPTRPFFVVSYLDHNGWQTATCYSGEIPNDYFRSRYNGWYYQNVTFSLIEQ